MKTKEQGDFIAAVYREHDQEKKTRRQRPRQIRQIRGRLTRPVGKDAKSRPPDEENQLPVKVRSHRDGVEIIITHDRLLQEVKTLIDRGVSRGDPLRHLCLRGQALRTKRLEGTTPLREIQSRIVLGRIFEIDQELGNKKGNSNHP